MSVNFSLTDQRSAIQSTAVSVRRTVTLHPYWEWRFRVAHDSSVSVRVVSGTAERDGTELVVNRSYRFKGALSKISTLFGCELEVEGDCERQHVAEIRPDSNDAIVQLNLHFLLSNLRNDAKSGKNSGVGPRIMVVGPNDVGKTTLARTLAARAVKVGSQPQVVNLDPREGMLSLPGTLTAATFATMMDVEGTGGWGGTPTSGPSSVPVKLPLVYYYGRQHATDDVQLYKEVVSNLAGAVTERMSTNVEAKSAGMIIDTPGVSLEGKLGEREMDVLAHIVEEFSVNMVVVLGSKDTARSVTERFHGDKTSLGDQTNVVGLSKPDGVADKDEAWLLACQHAAIKEYFFGDSKTTLNPSTQLLDIDSITIYRTPEREFFPIMTPSRFESDVLIHAYSHRLRRRAPRPREGRREYCSLTLDYAHNEQQGRRLPRISPNCQRSGLRLHCGRQHRSSQDQYPCPHERS